MNYIQNTTDFYIEEPTVISLGKFDGFHRGHELLLKHLKDKKREGYAAVIFTFDIPPRRGLDGQAVKVLTTNEEKYHMLAGTGIDYLIECPFTEEIMCMEAEDFVKRLVTGLHTKCFVVGSDFRFGHNRKGDYRLLQKEAPRYGYEVVVVEKMREGERDISSTYVRECIEAGDIKTANRLLGYRFFLTGVVEHGNRIGRTIGIPTINQLPPPEKILPPNGVYLSEVTVDGTCYHGITNVGTKPTIGAHNPIGVETHLLNFCGDIYDQVVTVEFLDKIRKEQKFDSIAELKAQLERDIVRAREYQAM